MTDRTGVLPRAWAVFALLAGTASTVGLSAQPVSPALSPVETHAAAGVAAANPDFPGLASLCSAPAPAVTPSAVRSGARRAAPGAANALPPMQVFDNLVFLGNRGVSAWALKTSRGLILIDTLNDEEEARIYIEEGLRKLGLDPSNIKAIVITHGHGDHTGGLDYLVRRYRPQVLMSAIDWEMVNNPKTRIDLPGWSNLPRPTTLVGKDMTLNWGDTRIQFVITPGHTPGTLSLVFPLKDGAVSHRAILWGGTGFNFGPIAARYRAYAASAEKMRRQVLAQSVDVFLSNHPARDQADVKMGELARRTPGGAHPFVLTPARVANAFVTFRECADAQVGRIE